MRAVAVILAGGTGTRVGRSIPKQLIEIGGKPIIEHSIAVFQASPVIDEIVIVMAPGHLDPVRAIVQAGGYDKVVRIIEGGQTRNESTSRALEALRSSAGTDEVNVLFHDAVRPLVTATIIADVVDALRAHEAVATAIPSSDTIIRVRPEAADGRVVLDDVLPRHELRRGQTPQAFRLSVITRAYELAWQDPDFTATDDCTVVLRYLPDVPIAVVPGHERNMKVTEPIDVHLAEKLLELEADGRS